MFHIRRRELIAVLGGAMGAGPLSARAQHPAKLPTIGFFGGASTGQQNLAIFAQRLRELGWIDSRTVTIEVRWSEGVGEHHREIAAEFVRLKVDVIVTLGTPATLAAKQATSSIPIVFVGVADPVGANGVTEVGLGASAAADPIGNQGPLSRREPTLPVALRRHQSADSRPSRLAAFRHKRRHVRRST